MYQALLDHISRFVTLTAGEQQLLIENLTFRHLNKKEYLLTEGDACTANHFVLKGCCRMYFIKEKGQEQIVQFGLENWWVTDYVSLGSYKPSGFYIQAVEASDVAILSEKKQEALFEAVPKLERYFRKILQRAYAASLTRFQYLFDQSAEERYRHFSHSYPEFVQRVPQYMLASLLNITPEVLSKIRAKK